MITKIDKKCPICQCHFQTYPSQNKTFCSSKCKNKHQSIAFSKENNPNWKSKKIICKFCGKEFFVSPSRLKRKCCSVECKLQEQLIRYKNKEQHPRWKGGLITRNCANCGKQINVERHKKDKRVFCSKRCSSLVTSKERPKKRVKRVCLTCKKEFEIHPNKLKRKDRNQGLYCSISCRAIDNVKKQHKKDTDIEIIMESWLNENSIIFIKNHPVEGITLVDFFIEPNIIIYCDGNYWHSLPDVKKRDERITKQLKKFGYLVFRLLGTDIKSGGRPYEVLQINKQKN